MLVYLVELNPEKGAIAVEVSIREALFLLWYAEKHQPENMIRTGI